MSEARYTMLLSVWRTFVPFLVGFAAAAAARWGFDLNEDLLESFLVLSFGTLYYALGRFLEQHVGKRWGWLLGYAKAPRYLRGRHRKPTESSTPGEPGPVSE